MPRLTHIKRLLQLCALAVLTAPLGCGDSGGEYPSLLPTDQLLAQPAIPGHASIAAQSPDQVVEDLTRAGQALSVSAAELTAAAPRADDLTARAGQLRARSQGAASQTGALTDRAAALRARICADPDADQANCPPGS